MMPITLHSKLIALQGQVISALEGEKILNQIRRTLNLRNSGEISIPEAGTRIRKAAWKIAEDLRMNGLDLSSGSDQFLLEQLPSLLKD